MRKPLFEHFGPPIWASKIKQQSYCFPPPFLDILFFNFMLICSKKRSLWGPIRNPVGANTGSKINEVAPKWLQNIVPRLPFFSRGFLTHLGCPLAHFWCLLVTFWYPSGPFCKMFNNSANTLLKSGCPRIASIERLVWIHFGWSVLDLEPFQVSFLELFKTWLAVIGKLMSSWCHHVVPFCTILEGLWIQVRPWPDPLAN